MKKQLLILSFLLFSSLIYAQSPIAKGESQINAGLDYHHGAYRYTLDLITEYIPTSL